MKGRWYIVPQIYAARAARRARRGGEEREGAEGELLVSTAGLFGGNDRRGSEEDSDE